MDYCAVGRIIGVCRDKDITRNVNDNQQVQSLNGPRIRLHYVASIYCRAQCLRGRASVSRFSRPGFESCAAVLKPWASLFSLHYSSSLSCINKYLAIDIDVYVYEQPSRINWSIWLDASQRS